MAEGDLAAARAAVQTLGRESLTEGLLVVAALSLAGLTRVEYLAGDWDNAVVSAERAIALAVESDDRWVIGAGALVGDVRPGARGDGRSRRRHVGAIRDQAPTFERHMAAEVIASAGLAAAQDRPAEC